MPWTTGVYYLAPGQRMRVRVRWGAPYARYMGVQYIMGNPLTLTTGQYYEVTVLDASIGYRHALDPVIASISDLDPKYFSYVGMWYYYVTLQNTGGAPCFFALSGGGVT